MRNSRSFLKCVTLLKFLSIIFLAGVTTLAANLAPAPGQAADTWAFTGSLDYGRSEHTATLLLNGKVLLASGLSSGPIANGLLYDQDTRVWTVTGFNIYVRTGHTATLFPDGKVLYAGGWNYRGDPFGSAQLYDPATGTWAFTGSLKTGRADHTATLLPSGQVLVAGGKPFGTYVEARAELYDPAAGTWAYTGSLNIGRRGHTATLLPNGKVLVAGGHSPNELLTSCELYDPATGLWTSTGGLNTAHNYHTATLMPNGKVLVAGGSTSTCELYDPATETWTPTGSLNASRSYHTATLLPNGKVLVVGTSSTGICELYDSTTGIWTYAANLNTPRYKHTATLLPNGKVLVAGGKDTSNNLLATCEVYGSQITHTITASAGSNGSIYPTGTFTVEEGSNYSFLITPATGYHVADVLVDGGSVGAVTNYTFTNITADHTISASFAINTYTITATAGAGGSISPGTTTVNYGGSQTFTIAANANYHITDVLVDGSSKGVISSYTFSNVTADHTISASFAINTFSILTSAGPGGAISPAAATVPYGGSQTFNIIPNTGYRVADVLVDGLSVGARTSYTFTNVTTGHTLSASFTSQPIEIIANQTSINVWPGRISTLLVRLGENPTGDATVTVTKSGNPAIIIQGGASLTFNAANWYVNQPVQLTVSGPSPDPSLPATVLLSGAGLKSATVEARIGKGKGPYSGVAMLLLLE